MMIFFEEENEYIINVVKNCNCLELKTRIKNVLKRVLAAYISKDLLGIKRTDICLKLISDLKLSGDFEEEINYISSFLKKKKEGGECEN